MEQPNFLLSITIALLAAIGYFVKRIFDRTDKLDMLVDDVAAMKPKVTILWEKAFANGKSPLTLNDVGKKILIEHGVKDIVDEESVLLLGVLKGFHSQNAYQVQENAKEAIKILIKDPAMLLRLEDTAFRGGVDVAAVLFIGSLYLRDLALAKPGFISLAT